MSDTFIPTPHSLHNRYAFGNIEKSIEDLPFFKVVALYLQTSTGDGYAALQMFGGETRELSVVTINNDVFYEQALQVAQYLWDLGYFIYFIHPRVPGRVVKSMAFPTEMYICWGSDSTKNRVTPCPCWTCPTSMQEKLECLGCSNFTVYASNIRRYKGG